MALPATPNRSVIGTGIPPSAIVACTCALSPLSELRRMIYAYPTFHRAVEDALRELDAT
jgi:hypothetical protein